MSRLIVAHSNRGAPDPIGLHDTTDTQIDPATKQKQQEIIDKLTPGAGNPATTVKITDEREGVGEGHFANISPDHFLQTQAWGTPLAAEAFGDDLFDTTNRWVETIVGAASQTVANSTLSMSVTTAAADSIKEKFDVIEIRSVPGAFTRYLISANIGTTFQTGNVKEFGFTDLAENDSAFYRVSGSSLFLVTEINGVETTHDITSFMPTDGKIHIYDMFVLGTGQILAHIDDVLAFSAPISDTLIGNKQFIPFMAHFNNALLAGVADDLEIQWLVVADLSNARIAILGLDDDNIIQNVRTTKDGRLKVSQEPPAAPVGTTGVVQTEFDAVAATDDNVFLIPNGEILNITRFAGGAEVDTSAGNSIELYFDINGDGTVLDVIDVIFASGTSDQHDLAEAFTGDGTAAIRMRRRRFSGGSKEIFGRWEGYF